MPKEMVPEVRDPCIAVAMQASILANFQCRMGIREAAEYIGVTDKEIRSAIETGKIRYYKVGKGSKRLSPAFLAEYVSKYKTFQNTPLPG